MVRQAHHERRLEDFEKALMRDGGPLTRCITPATVMKRVGLDGGENCYSISFHIGNNVGCNKHSQQNRPNPDNG